MKYEKGDFCIVPNIHALAGLDPMAQCIFLWICIFAGDKITAFPSVKKLCDMTGIKSRTTVVSKIDLLISKGFLVKDIIKKPNGENLSNTYTILLIQKTEGNKKAAQEMGGVGQEIGGVVHLMGGVPQEMDTNYIHVNINRELDTDNNILRSPLSQNSSSEELLTSENSNSLNLPLTNGGESSKETGGRLELDEKQIKEDEKKEMDKNIASVIKVFNDINKACGYAHKGHRTNAELLLKEYGIDIVLDMAKTAIASNRLEYAPIILTPSDLFYKLEKLKLFVDKQKG